MNKRLLSLFVIATLLVSTIFSGCSGGGGNSAADSSSAGPASSQQSGDNQATVTFKISSGVSGLDSLQNVCVQEIVQKLSERSGGRIQGTQIAGGVLGAEREVTEAIQLNTLEMAVVSDMGIDAVVGGMGWAWMPFMITNYEDADKYYNEGWIGEELGNQMAAANIIRLAAIENDFRMIGNVKRPIRTMEDFKGLKVRTPEIPEVLRFYELTGALPVAIAVSEVLTALEQKTIDGVDNTVYNYHALGVLGSLKYITRTNYMYSSGSIIMSKAFWESLSPEDQQMFTEVAKDAGVNFRTSWREQSESLLNEGVANGTFIVEEMSDEIYQALKANAATLWDEFGSKYDQRLVERVKAEFGV